MKPLNLWLAITSLIIDAVAIFGGLWLAYVIRTHGGELFNWPFDVYLRRAVMVTPIWLLAFASQGLYNPRTLPRGWQAVGRMLIGLVAGWGIVLITLYFWRSKEATTLSRLLIAYAIVWSSVFLLAGRLVIGTIVDVLFRTGAGSIRTVIINGAGSDNFVRELKNGWVHGHKVIDVLPSENAVAKLAELSRTEKIEEVIVDHPQLPEAKLLELLNWTDLNGANFAVVPSLLSVRATNVETVTLAGTPVMYFLRTPLEGWRRIYKRLFDLLLVTPTLVILSPIYLLIALLVKVSSPGPVIFRQERVGQDGQPLQIHKFRSMYRDGDQRFGQFGGWSGDEATDPRITPLGRILRKTNLDELPQLWDIFIGKMSIVGPRPEQPRYVEKFAKEVPKYLHRHHVKAGLTGWAQINGLRGDTSIEERVKYDLFYIEHWTIWFDIRIILATLLLVPRELFGRRPKTP